MKNKIVLSESEKSEIKKMYGILNEQVQLPVVVSDTYTAKNCDELHAFQSTSGKVIGNMNVTVGNKLEEIYNSGINPKPVKVNVTVTGMKVSWSVTIDKSNDGKSWVGFTSRGAGCNADVYNRAVSSSQGNDMKSAKQKIMSTYGESDIEIEVVNDFEYEDDKNGFRQVFYRYTKPSKYPSKSSNQSQVKNDDNTTKDSNLPRRTTGSVVLEKDAFNKLSKKIQDYSNREFESGEGLSVGEFNLSYKNNENKIFVEISDNPSGEKYSKLVLAINDEAKRAQESKGYSLIKSGKIQLPGEFASSNPDGYSWYLFGETIK